MVGEQGTQERLAELEEALAWTRAKVHALEHRVQAVEAARRQPSATLRRPAPVVDPRPVVPVTTFPVRSPATLEVPRVELQKPQTPDAPKTSLADLVGGRWLAWIGALATLLGIVLFVAFAISHGWIGEAQRVALAAIASAGLLAGGAWLHRSRGRTEAAVATVGAGTAGLFATLVVASEIYE
jgi:uncharacterized membrane protein